MKQSNVRILCECAILLALSVALSLIKLFTLPFDGSITPVSMLPVLLIGIKYGTRNGLLTAFCFSWFQILSGGVFGWGLTPAMLIGSLLLDYILAYSVLGLSGLFRKKGLPGVIGGIALSCALRFLFHFLSGVILWANYAQFVAFGESFVNHPVLYSVCYNGVYMLPETVLTVLVALLLFRIPRFRQMMQPVL